MANRIHNTNMTFEEIAAEEEPAKVTPLIGGIPTPEEEAAAFEELLREQKEGNA